MNQDFSHIASINFRHDYSGKGLFEGFSVSWAPEISRRLANLQLLIKPFAGGIHVLSSDPELLRGETEPLLFRLYPTDPLFFNFTDFGQEVRPNSKVFFFSNSTKSKSADYLHSGDFVTLEESLDSASQRTIDELLKQLSGGNASLWDARGEKLVPGDYARYFLEKGESVFYVSNGSGTTGFYRRGSAMERTPFGIISLEPNQLYHAYRGAGETLSLQIRFRSRRTFWKYILSDRVFDKFTRLSVIDAQNNEIVFKEEEFEIQPAWKVRSFLSEVEIPFNVDFNPRFQLIERSKEESQAGKVVYKQLPKASPEQLFQRSSNIEISYSHIFI